MYKLGRTPCEKKFFFLNLKLNEEFGQKIALCQHGSLISKGEKMKTYRNLTQLYVFIE